MLGSTLSPTTRAISWGISYWWNPLLWRLILLSILTQMSLLAFVRIDFRSISIGLVSTLYSILIASNWTSLCWRGYDERVLHSVYQGLGYERGLDPDEVLSSLQKKKQIDSFSILSVASRMERKEILGKDVSIPFFLHVWLYIPNNMDKL